MIILPFVVVIRGIHESSTAQQLIQEHVKKAQDELTVADKEIRTLEATGYTM